MVKKFDVPNLLNNTDKINATCLPCKYFVRKGCGKFTKSHSSKL